MVTEKTFEGYLIVDWRNGSMRAVRRKNKTLKPSEIPIKVSIKVKLPEVKEYVAKGEITVSETKVDEMLIEEL